LTGITRPHKMSMASVPKKIITSQKLFLRNKFFYGGEKSSKASRRIQPPKSNIQLNLQTQSSESI
jgi:hypothetical protein